MGNNLATITPKLNQVDLEKASIFLKNLQNKRRLAIIDFIQQKNEIGIYPSIEDIEKAFDLWQCAASGDIKKLKAVGIVSDEPFPRRKEANLKVHGEVIGKINRWLSELPNTK